MPYEIPAPGTVVDPIELDQHHPEYVRLAPWYRFLRESDEGSGGFAPVVDSYTRAELPARTLESYLVPHEREDDTGYQWRIRRARPLRYTAMGIQITAGVLTYRPPRRDAYPDRLQEWMQAVTVEGTDFETAVATMIVPTLERYGWCMAYLHRPYVQGDTVLQVQAAREAVGLPELILDVITPEQIRGWERSVTGEFLWIRYVEHVYVGAGPRGGAGATIRRHWWLTPEGWWYVDDLRSTVEGYSPRSSVDAADASTRIQGDQTTEPVTALDGSTELRVGGSGRWSSASLGVVPVAVWQLPGRNTPAGPSALAQLEYFRAESELKKIEASTAFPQLWVPEIGQGVDPRTKIRGDDVIGTFPHDSRHVPQILTPESGPFDHYMKRLERLESEAMAPWGLQIQAGASTGLALSLIQERATNLYRAHAKACTQGEYATLQLAARLLGLSADDVGRAQWPTEFSSLASTQIVNDVETFLGFSPGRSYEQHAIREAARVILPHLTQTEIEEADRDLEARYAEDDATAAEERDGEVASGGGDGLPPALDPERSAGGGGLDRLDGRQG